MAYVLKNYPQHEHLGLLEVSHCFANTNDTYIPVENFEIHIIHLKVCLPVARLDQLLLT